VQFRVHGGTDIFVTAPSIQAFKSSDLYAEMDVNNLITFICTQFLILRPFVLRIFALMPLANVHHFLIFALSFLV